LYWEKYLKVKTLHEAMEILKLYQGKARLIAGGTDLVLQLREKKKRVSVLVDISDLPELQYIKEEHGQIKIGAMTTHSQLAASPLLWEKVIVLAQAASSVGSPQIRNVGTVGGNIVNAQPAADTVVALMALDAKVVVFNNDGGEEKIPFSELFLGVGESKIDPTSQLLKEISFSLLPEMRSSLGRLARRKALALPILNIGIVLSVNKKENRLHEARICVAPVAPVPMRMKEAEKTLLSRKLSDELLISASKAAFDAADPRNSKLRGNTAYRKELVRVMTYRTLKTALATRGGVGDEAGRVTV